MSATRRKTPQIIPTMRPISAADTPGTSYNEYIPTLVHAMHATCTQSDITTLPAKASIPPNLESKSGATPPSFGLRFPPNF